MRLSEAIRKGCVGTYQVFEKVGGSAGTCALGAAFKGALGVSPEYLAMGSVVNELILRFGKIIFADLKCQRCEVISDACKTIVHMNDGHRVSREEIADYIELKLERPLEISERESGEPPAIPAKTVWDYIGSPVEDPKEPVAALGGSLGA